MCVYYSVRERLVEKQFENPYLKRGDRHTVTHFYVLFSIGSFINYTVSIINYSTINYSPNRTKSNTLLYTIFPPQAHLFFAY